MTQHSCIIVEDQPLAQRLLKKYIEDVGSLALSGTFNNAVSAIQHLQATTTDIMFLDIHLPKISGIELLKILSPRPKVILTTAFSEYAIQGYELDVVDYLLKPFSFERFVKATTKAIKEVLPIINVKDEKNNKYNNSFFIRTGSEYINLQMDKIKYIKSEGDYTSIYQGKSRHLIAQPLRYWIEELPSNRFCQVHKSYIVNVKQISKIAGSQIIIDGIVIPIGRTYKEKFFVRFLEQRK